MKVIPQTIPKISIGSKLNLAFGATVLMTICAIALAYLGIEKASEKISKTHRVRLPAVLAINQLEGHLQQMISSTRSYLVLGDRKHYTDYESARLAFEQDLATLELSSVTHWLTAENQSRRDQLRQLYTQWSQLPKKLFDLYDDPLLREPALRILTQRVQPVIAAITSDIQKLISEQQQLTPSAENSRRMNDMATFQATFLSMVSSLKSYATTGQKSFLFEYRSRRIQNDRSFGQMARSSQAITPSQQIIWANIIAQRTAFMRFFDEIDTIIKGVHARQDLFFFQHEVMPGIEKMLALVEQISLDQQRFLQLELAQGNKELASALWETLLGGLLTILSGFCFIWILRQTILPPIRQLTQAASQIRKGDLETRAEVLSRDEIGLLALTFNRMTQQLKRSLQQSRMQAASFKRMVELGDQLNAILEPERITGALADQLKQLFGFEFVHFMAWNNTEQKLVPAANADLNAEKDIPALCSSDPESLVSVAARTQRLAPLQQLVETQAFLVYQLQIAIPIQTEDRLMGVLFIQTQNQTRFEAHDMDLFRLLANQTAVALANADLFKRANQARIESQAAQKNAERAYQSKTNFLANMSHELRTPLNAILGYSAILRQHWNDQQDLRPIDIIEQSSEHLLNLINGILDLSKIEVGKIELNAKAFQLSDFIEKIADIINAQAKAKQLTFQYIQNHSLPDQIIADETRLRQILFNLLDNAIKFTAKGEITLKAACLNIDDFTASSGDLHDARLRFEVADTGIGIPKDQLTHIFESFEQVEDAYQHSEGTGLGLAICQQLTELMGGTLSVQSETGRGSVFCLDIRVPAKMAPGQPAILEKLIKGYQGARRKVIIADPMATSRTMMVDLLKSVDFETYATENIKEAFALAETVSPNLFFLDLSEEDGLSGDLPMQLREHILFYKVPIFLLLPETKANDAAALFEDMEQSLYIISKPIRWRQVKAMLETHLGIEWIYEDEPSSPKKASAEKSASIDMSIPTFIDLKKLYDLAKVGDLRAVQREAGRLQQENERYHLFSVKLQQLANNFESREIKSMIQKYMEDAH